MRANSKQQQNVVGKSALPTSEGSGDGWYYPRDATDAAAEPKHPAPFFPLQRHRPCGLAPSLLSLARRHRIRHRVGRPCRRERGDVLRQ